MDGSHCSPLLKQLSVDLSEEILEPILPLTFCKFLIKVMVVYYLNLNCFWVDLELGVEFYLG